MLLKTWIGCILREYYGVPKKLKMITFIGNNTEKFLCDIMKKFLKKCLTIGHVD